MLGEGGSDNHVVQVLLITVNTKLHFAMQIFIVLGCVLFLGFFVRLTE